MNIGLDIGYSAVKAVTDRRRTAFPSAVGTPEKARFSLSENTSIVLVDPEHVHVGESAIQQSRFLRRREDRAWIESNEWYNLFLAAMSELTTATYAEIRLVTGLPVAFFDDRAVMRERLLGRHRCQREGRTAQMFDVADCRVIPQPFGALLAEVLDRRGRITDNVLATGNVGVVDVGGKTCNLLSVNKLSEIRDETGSVDVGGWTAIRAIRDYLTGHYPGLERLHDHRIADAVIARRIRYYGETIDLTTAVEDILAPMADKVIAEATHLWGDAATLDALLIGGGGALLLGPYITRHFRHARVIAQPVFANAWGYWQFAQRLWSRY